MRTTRVTAKLAAVALGLAAVAATPAAAASTQAPEAVDRLTRRVVRQALCRWKRV
jgi:hypothetical protein